MQNKLTKPPTKAQKRFHKICNLLAQGKSMKAQELADILECTRKTVSNDLKPLVQKGIVQYASHHYTMVAEYRAEYKKEQSQMLNSMMQGLLHKIIPQMADAHDTLFYFDFEIETIEDETTFVAIANAISQKTAISFDYTNRQGKKSYKTVYPLKISNFSGIWYLLAYDLVKEDLRNYHIQDIKNLTFCEENYLTTATIKQLEKKAKEIDSPWFDAQKKTVTLYVKDIAKTLIQRKNIISLKL